MSEQTMYKTNNHESKLRKLHAWEIVLLVLGSPIWLSLLIAAIAVVFSVYISLWSIIISLWAIFGSIVACAFAGILCGIVFAMVGYGITGVAMIAAGLILAGLSIFLFYGCKLTTTGTVLLTKKILRRLKKG